MNLTRAFMILSLSFLVFILFTTINEKNINKESFYNLENNITDQPEKNVEPQIEQVKKDLRGEPFQVGKNDTNCKRHLEKLMNEQKKLSKTMERLTGEMKDNKKKEDERFQNTKIDYSEPNTTEHFQAEVNAAGDGAGDDAAAGGDGAAAGDGGDGDVAGDNADDGIDNIDLDGTDLLAAPLAERFNSVNSIANVNRNASNDLRGDVPINYICDYTPFYQSHIYGDPLHTNKLF